jgi:hypothetical protein
MLVNVGQSGRQLATIGGELIRIGNRINKAGHLRRASAMLSRSWHFGCREPERWLKFPLVGVGGSAGGLDAYTRPLRNLPADLGVAVVIVNHLRKTATLLHESSPTTRRCRSHSSPRACTSRLITCSLSHRSVTCTSLMAIPSLSRYQNRGGGLTYLLPFYVSRPGIGTES